MLLADKWHLTAVVGSLFSSLLCINRPLNCALYVYLCGYEWCVFSMQFVSNKSNGSPRFWWLVIIVWGDCIHFYFSFARIMPFSSKNNRPLSHRFCLHTSIFSWELCVCLSTASASWLAQSTISMFFLGKELFFSLVRLVIA